MLTIIPPDNVDSFVRLLDNGSQLGMNIQYVEQKVQRGVGFEKQLEQVIEGERGVGTVVDYLESSKLKWKLLPPSPPKQV